MPKQIWNEGRVQGYSAYEIYLKQSLSDNPDLQPATEREWLASSIACGSSMVVKIPKTSNDTGYLDISLPENSKLCAANVIFANLFLGDCEYDVNSYFAKRVINYGFCISNTLNFHPDTNGTQIPTTDDDISLESVLSYSEAYNKIIDGVVIQPGKWKETGDEAGQYMDLSPDMSKSPFMRIFYSGKIESTIQIMLTGFTIRSVISGVCGLDGSYNATSPQDGTFLGPAQFPWAAKIIFSQSTATSISLNMSNYIRQINGEKSISKLRGKSLVDMETCDPSVFYSSKQPDAKIDFDSCNLDSPDGKGNILTIHSKSDKYSPAIYATRYNPDKEKSLSPFNVVGKGTVQMFDNSTSDADMKEYEQTYPGTFSLRRKDDGSVETLNENNDIVPVASIAHKELSYTNIVTSDKKAKGIVTSVGNKKSLSVSLSGDDNDSQLPIGDDGTSNGSIGSTSFNKGTLAKLYPSSSNVTPASILEAFANNKSIDILGDRMKALKSGLEKETSAGNVGYIQLPNGLRLYISATKPTATDVPIGSIGIGWTEE
jgi:hypothetical protein